LLFSPCPHRVRIFVEVEIFFDFLLAFFEKNSIEITVICEEKSTTHTPHSLEYFLPFTSCKHPLYGKNKLDKAFVENTLFEEREKEDFRQNSF
jgi:hypothetical protein